jgi:hypothetical protein
LIDGIVGPGGATDAVAAPPVVGDHAAAPDHRRRDDDPRDLRQGKPDAARSVLKMNA